VIRVIVDDRIVSSSESIAQRKIFRKTRYGVSTDGHDPNAQRSMLKPRTAVKTANVRPCHGTSLAAMPSFKPGITPGAT
jgi:hypothetical protein